MGGWPGGGCGCGCNGSGTNGSCGTNTTQGQQQMNGNYNDPAAMAQQMMAAAQNMCNQTMESVSRMNSGLVGGGPGPMNYNSNGPFGWDDVRAEDCFRTNSQRGMSPDSRLFAAISNVSGAAVDIWPGLLAALGIPAVGNTLAIILANGNVSLNRLALVSLLAKVVVSITPVAASDNFDSDSAAEALKNLIGSFIGLSVTTNDDTERWVSATPIDYWYPQGSNDYRRIPPLVFRQTENQSIRLQRFQTNVPNVAAADPAFFIPNNQRVEVTIHTKGIWLSHPSCGCNWPGMLCMDPGKVGWKPDDSNNGTNPNTGAGTGVSTPANGGMANYGQGYI